MYLVSDFVGRDDDLEGVFELTKCNSKFLELPPPFLQAFHEAELQPT